MNYQKIEKSLNPPINQPQLNMWAKIKKELKRRNIKDKEKLLYKEKIGFKIIEDNKYLLGEILNWSVFYNDYHPKMSLYYKHVKEYIPLFKRITSKSGEILKEIIKRRLRIKTEIITKRKSFMNQILYESDVIEEEILDKNDEILVKIKKDPFKFATLLEDYIVSQTNNDDYRNILRILTYDYVETQTEFKDYVYKEYQMVIDEDKNLENIEYMRNALLLENNYLLEEERQLIASIDKMSDMITSESFLSRQKLISLADYLDKNYDDISSNILKFSLDSDEKDF